METSETQDVRAVAGVVFEASAQDAVEEASCSCEPVSWFGDRGFLQGEANFADLWSKRTKLRVRKKSPNLFRGPPMSRGSVMT